ncbi:unnamed protein product, partial [Meganyctiphanes norvegica]
MPQTMKHDCSNSMATTLKNIHKQNKALHTPLSKIKEVSSTTIGIILNIGSTLCPCENSPFCEDPMNSPIGLSQMLFRFAFWTGPLVQLWIGPGESLKSKTLHMALAVGIWSVLDVKDSPGLYRRDVFVLGAAEGIIKASASQSSFGNIPSASLRGKPLKNTLKTGYNNQSLSRAPDAKRSNSFTTEIHIRTIFVAETAPTSKELMPSGQPKDPATKLLELILSPSLSSQKSLLQWMQVALLTLCTITRNWQLGIRGHPVCISSYQNVCLFIRYRKHCQISSSLVLSSTLHQTMAYLQSLIYHIRLTSTPVTGMLCRKFTSRRVSFVGGLLCGLGLVLGAMATSINHLILTLGMLTGLGGGLTTTPGILIVSLYFEKRRALASAICVSGNAFGGFFQPMMIDWLLEKYGLRGTLLILGALQFNICAASMLYRPIREHAKIQAREREELEKLKTVDSSCNVDGEKLLPAQPLMPDVPFQTSAPNTPLNRSTAIWNKVVRKRLESISQDEDEELRRQVSFLRSSSMMNSIPDLSEYARSWTMTDEAFMRSRGSFALTRSRGSINRSNGSIRCHPSKGSLSKLSFGSSKGSKGSMDKLGSTEVKRPQLIRLMSEEKPRPSGVYASHGSKNSLNRVQSEGRTSLLRKVSLRQKAKTMMKEGIIQEQDSESEKSLEVQGSSQSLKEKGIPLIGRITQLKEEASLYDRKENEPAVEPIMEPLFVSAINETANKDYNDTTSINSITEKDKMLEKEGKEAEMRKEDDTMSVESDEPGCCFYVLRCCDCNLMRNPLFWVMAISVSCMAAGAPHVLFFMPAYATSIGIASTATTSLLSISSLVDLFGRLGIGFISDLGLIKPSYIYVLCSGLAAFSVLMLPVTSSFVGLAVLLGIYGFGVGAWFVLIPTLLASHHGAIRLAASYGLTRLFQGIINFISPQVCGMLIDVTGGYDSTFYYMGTFMVLSSIIVIFENPLFTQQKKKEELLKKQ